MDSHPVRAEVAGVLPLHVTDYAITETFFNVWGHGWSLAINCDWSLSRRGLTIATWLDDDDRIDRAIAMLKDRAVVAITVDEDLVDPVITFDDGVELVVQADTDLDPWVLRAEGLPVIFVGRASQSLRPERVRGGGRDSAGATGYT